MQIETRTKNRTNGTAQIPQLPAPHLRKKILFIQISMTLFQNQDLNGVSGENLIKNLIKNQDLEQLPNENSLWVYEFMNIQTSKLQTCQWLLKQWIVSSFVENDWTAYATPIQLEHVWVYLQFILIFRWWFSISGAW